MTGGAGARGALERCGAGVTLKARMQRSDLETMDVASDLLWQAQQG